MGFDGDKKSHRHPERQRMIQGRRCEISYKVCKACHPGLEPVPASAGMTSGSSEIFVRVGDCTRKQNSREAIATCCTSELCDRETNMLYMLGLWRSHSPTPCGWQIKK